MFDKSARNLAAVLSASLSAIPAAQAAPTTFFGENLTPSGTVSGDPVSAQSNFLSGLSGVGTEDFEGFTDGTQQPFDLTFPGSTGDINATLSGGSAEIDEVESAGRFATSGSRWIDTETGSGFNISFSDPISAFGFFGTDIGDIGGEVILTLTNGTTETLNIGNSTNDDADGALLFFGFTDTIKSYKKIEFENTSFGDAFGFDDMTIGDLGQVEQVPIPATVGLLSFGLIGLSLVARPRREA